MAPTRTLTTRELRKVSPTSAPSLASGGQKGKERAVKNTESALAKYPSCTEVFALLKETAFTLLPLKDEPIARLQFKEGTPVMDRIDYACQYRGVAPAAFGLTAYVTKGGEKRVVCLACPQNRMTQSQHPLRHLHGPRKTFSAANAKSLSRHPSSDQHLKVTATLLRIDWRCLQNRLRCPVTGCPHAEAGERMDALQRHVRQQHPGADLPYAVRSEVDSAPSTSSPVIAAQIPAPASDFPLSGQLSSSGEPSSSSLPSSLPSLTTTPSASPSPSCQPSISASASPVAESVAPLSDIYASHFLPFSETLESVAAAVAQINAAVQAVNPASLQLRCDPVPSALFANTAPSAAAHNLESSLPPLPVSFEGVKALSSLVSPAAAPGAVDGVRDHTVLQTWSADDGANAPVDLQWDQWLNFDW